MQRFHFIIILSIFTSPFLQAQEGVHLGAHFTPKSPLIFNQNNYGDRELEYKFTFGYAAGLEAGLYFTDQLGMFTGIQYTTQGQEYQDENQQTDINRHVMLDYLRIPLYLRFSTDAESVGFYANAGGYVGFLNSAEIDYQVGVFDLSLPDAADRFKDVDAGILAGLGAKINFSEQLYSTAGLRFTYGFLDINHEDWQIPNNDGQYDASHNGSIGVNLSINYVIEAR